MRLLAALALLGVGLDHLEQYAVDHYSAVPTIGPLFLANFAAATALALVVALRGGRVPAAAGIGVAAGSLLALYLSEHGGLFGFAETGFRPAIAVSVALEAAAVLALAPQLRPARRPLTA
jgi:uncharacterized oligopeptide transporter (OPT) family protein